MPRKPAPAPTANGPPDPGSAVAHKRREQVIEAAIGIIATEGVHKLSLGNIERRTRMTRGHLTYYFPTKEDILLAVFDRMLQRMIAERMAEAGPKPGTGRAWECATDAFVRVLEPPGPDRFAFYSLVHTFHAQLNFRADFREKIAGANANWREMIAADYAGSVPAPPVRPAVFASLAMALLQGLSGQTAVDPRAFDRAEMLAAVRLLLAPLFGKPAAAAEGTSPVAGPPKPKRPPARSRKGKPDD